MVKLGNNHSNLDLKCDFPARESFRESLLTRLFSLDERGTREKEPDGGMNYLGDDPEIRELSDSDLEMLAAARGEMQYNKGWLGGSSPSER